MLVLVDMDGPLADFEDALWRQMRSITTDAIDPADRRGFYAADDYRYRYGDEAADLATELITAPGFYRTFDTTAGAGALLEALEGAWHDTFICTSPLGANPTCASDKLDWITDTFGERWRRRTIITSDKTLVVGDVLIDDKPNVTGCRAPTWTQLLFNTAQNQGPTDQTRVGPWDEAAIAELLEMLEER